MRLPLTGAEFRRALCTGHGRALQHVSQYGAVGLDEAIIDAVIHNRVWDAQCEGSRDSWMVEIVCAAGLCLTAVEALQEASADPVDKDSFFDRDQQCAIAGKLAEKGIPGARQVLYEMFQPSTDSADVLGLEAIIELDGRAGLLFACGKIGQMLGNGPSFPVSQEPLAVFDNLFGEGEARKVLEAVAGEDPDIWRYIQALRCDGERPDSQMYRKIPASGFDPTNWKSWTDRVVHLSGTEVVSLVRRDPNDELAHSLITWGKHAATPDLEFVLDTILTETDVVRIGRLLRSFYWRGFPRFDERMMSLLNTEEERIHYHTVTGLSGLKDPRVRKLAIDRLVAGVPRDGLRLLKSNFLPSDVRILKQVLHPLPDPNENHWMIVDLIKLLQANELPVDAGDLVLFAYEHTPCMNDRGDAVKLLLSLQVTPGWVLEECRFDGSMAIRELASGAGESEPH